MRNYLGSVQDSITNSIVTLDNHHRVKTLNKAAEAWLRETMAGMASDDIRNIVGQKNRKLAGIDRSGICIQPGDRGR